jgi:DNA-directed RNA polymerase subunit RPC12/RpoP
MKATKISADGSVHCPKCNSTSFTAQRTKKVKVTFGLASLLAAPKLRCNGCGEYLKPGVAVKPFVPTTRFDRIDPLRGQDERIAARQAAYAAKMAPPAG